MYKGIIFDFNGTLFEDTDLQADAWEIVIEKYFHRKMYPNEFRNKFLGLGNADILVYLNSLDPQKQFDISITDEKETTYRQILLERKETISLIPGVVETMDILKSSNIPIAIATASEITNVEFYYDFFQLYRWFDQNHIVYDDFTIPLKPAPDIYFRAAERLSLTPEDCVVCEDTLNGLIAAYSAKAARIFIRGNREKFKDYTEKYKIFGFIEDFSNFYPDCFL